MKTRVSRSLAFFALLLMLAAESLTFLPSARAQVTQAEAAFAAQSRGRGPKPNYFASTCRRCWRVYSPLVGWKPPIA